MRAILLPSLLVCLLTAAPTAQNVVVGNTAWHGDIVTSKDGLTLPAGEFTVGELIDAVARYLCRNYLYEPQVVADAVGFELQRRVALDALGSEEVLYALLAARNLAALPLDEAREHPHLKAREAYVERDGVWHTAPAPRFSRTPGTIRDSGMDGADVVARWARED